MKNILIGTLFVASALLFSCGTGFSEQMYQMNQSELSELETIFKSLKNINTTLSSDLKLSKVDLQNLSLKLRSLEIRLTELQTESKLAKEDLLKAQSSLIEVRKSFVEYEKEMNRKLKIKNRQKIVVGILAGILGFGIGGAFK